ncbi:amino acid adenylation domain-containing protein, partial [Candidatus Poribacteria bacterium]
ISGVQVLREMIRRRGDPLRAAMPVVFTSTLGLHESGQSAIELTGLGKICYGISQTPQVQLDYQVSESDGALVYNWDAVEEIFPKGLLDDMFDVYYHFLLRLADDEESWQETKRQLIPSAQLEQRAAINATEVPVSADMLHALFAKQVQQRPRHTAVVASTRTLDYGAVYHMANKVGRQLRTLGARPNTLVAVVMEKGWEEVIAVLGILQSGAAYLPISPELPKERLWYLLQNGAVELALTQPHLDTKLEWPANIERLCVDDRSLSKMDGDGATLEPVQRSEDLAYVIYTSGSTGFPKGVMIEHGQAVNTILDINRRFGVGPGDRVLALSSLSFDLSVYDIFGTLAAGGTIVIPDAPAVRDPASWADLIIREEVTIWNSVPALMGMLVEYLDNGTQVPQLPLRLVLLSGDWIPVDLPDRVKPLAEGVQVISLGGATEASIWSIFYPIEDVDPDVNSIPYGRPLTNQSFHVLDESLEPCPAWVPGQLYIGGIGLARGYWQDPEKTKASFITHPDTGERLYRTGDMGRYLTDGNIEFLGREDFQVKVQGYRVELGEVEANLLQHPKVGSTVVIASGERHDNKHLWAYVVPDEQPAAASEELRLFLQEKLPDYMIPSAFVTLDALPLTANGKVDRGALPEPSRQVSEVSADREADVEMVGIADQISWLAAGVLKMDHIDLHVNLLELGANSVDMIRIVNLLDKEMDFRPDMDEFYLNPTLSGLVECYEQAFQSQASTEEPEPAPHLTDVEVLLDPEERDEFRSKQYGLRRETPGETGIELSDSVPVETLKTKYIERRSYRHFVEQPIPLADFSKFIGCLHQISLDGRPKYLYASAGGLYPVQTYLYVKEERVEGISAGTYYYHPADHRLVLLSANASIDRNIHERFVNRPIYDEAAFSIFLIARLDAIEPMYGEHSLDFAILEAGYMSQLMMMSAIECQIGLCPIGVLDFKQIRHLFALEEKHRLVHSLLGGQIDHSMKLRWLPLQADYITDTTDEEREEGRI